MVKPYKKKNSGSEGNHGRDKNLVRSLSRRKPQYILLAVNVIVLLTLLVLLPVALYSLSSLHRAKERDKLDQQIIERHARANENRLCPLKWNAPFNTSYCSEYCGTDSIIYQAQQVDKDSPFWSHISDSDKAHCVTRYQILDCHEDLLSKGNNSRACLPKRENVTECFGFDLGGTLDDALDSTGQRIAPAFNISMLPEMMNKTYLANELVIHCPTCIVSSEQFQLPFEPSSTYFSAKSKCYVKIKTTKPGWPGNFKYCANILWNETSTDCSIIESKA